MNFTFAAVLAYLLLSLIWIMGSDRLLLGLAATPQEITLLQTAKGFFFVAVSGFLMYWLATRERAARKTEASSAASPAGAPALLLRPLLIAALVFLTASGIGALTIHLAEQSRVLIKQQHAYTTAGNYAWAFQEQIYRSISATYALAAVLRQGRGEIHDFEKLAQEMLPLYPGVSALQLAPGGVIRRSVPLAGNEKAIGHDLLKDPQRNKEAFLAFETRKLTLAGPFELLQGGIAVIGRLPVFLADRDGQERFWGFTTALIRISHLLAASRLDTLAQAGYHYQLWRLHPDTGKKQIFASSTAADLDEPIFREIEVPNGKWTLSLAPAQGWHSPQSLLYEIAMGLAASLFAAGIGYFLARQPEMLRRLVEERTRQLGEAIRLSRKAEERFRSLVEVTSDWVWEVDQGGVYTYASPKVRDILGYEPDEVVGKTPFDLMSPEEAGRVGAIFAATAAEQKPFAMLENINLHKDGHEVVLETSAVPIYDGAGGFRGYRGIDRDITVRRKAEEHVRKLSRAVEQSANAVVIADIKGDIEYVNPRFCEVTGYSPEEVIGRNPRLLKSGETAPEVYKNLWDTLLAGKVWFGEFHNRKKNGELYWCLESISPVKDEQGRVTHFVAIGEDISERKLAESTIRHLAYYDHLTGLPNRRLFRDRFDQAAAAARRGRHSLALLYLDVDRMKRVNDTLGHAAGDALLKAVAGRIAGAVRDEDTVARLEGDEFAILLSEIRTAESTARVAEKLAQALKLPFRVMERELYVTASIGISLYPQDTEDLDTLNQNADIALHRAKELGDRFSFFTADMNAVTLQHLNLENSLRRALERDELVLHFQPQVNLANGRINGAEALLRWRHPEHGLMAPSYFIPLAEETGLIVPIGEWVLRQACAQAQAWRAEGLPFLRVAVNLSARQFREKQLVQTIAGTLKETGLPPEWLELEITESIVMEHSEEALATLRQLSAMGLTFAIDDFGTGYSSLSYLKRMPIQVLKIDQSFVRDIGTDPDDRAIVSAIVTLAHVLKLKVVAEGVETREQLEYLRSVGCDNMQGYLSSRPLEAAAFRALLDEKRAPGPLQ